MERFDVRRYIAIETAISVAINTVAGVVPAALSFSGQGTVPLLGARALALDAAPQFFMGALMSALVPSLLTRMRHSKGKLGPGLDGNGPTVARTMLVSLLMAASSALLGMALAGAVLPRIAGQGLGVGTMLLLNGAYGGLLAALVTPSALLLIFLITHLPQPFPGGYDARTRWICAKDRDGPQRRAVPERAQRARL